MNEYSNNNLENIVKAHVERTFYKEDDYEIVLGSIISIDKLSPALIKEAKKELLKKSSRKEIEEEAYLLIYQYLQEKMDQSNQLGVNSYTRAMDTVITTTGDQILTQLTNYNDFLYESPLIEQEDFSVINERQMLETKMFEKDRKKEKFKILKAIKNYFYESKYDIRSREKKSPLDLALFININSKDKGDAADIAKYLKQVLEGKFRYTVEMKDKTYGHRELIRVKDFIKNGDNNIKDKIISSNKSRKGLKSGVAQFLYQEFMKKIIEAKEEYALKYTDLKTIPGSKLKFYRKDGGHTTIENSYIYVHPYNIKLIESFPSPQKEESKEQLKKIVHLIDDYNYLMQDIHKNKKVQIIIAKQKIDPETKGESKKYLRMALYQKHNQYALAKL